MIKSPIPKVSEKLQYRAIGLIYGRYKPLDFDSLNKGLLSDGSGNNLDSVVLGKALPLIKKYIKFERKYFWIVYPRNKNDNNLHLQIAGIWDPNNFDDSFYQELNEPDEILAKLNLSNNFFSIRGKLVFVNISQNNFLVKIYPSNPKIKSKSKSFKIRVKGEIPLKLINSFVSIEAIRKGDSLEMKDFEVIET